MLERDVKTAKPSGGVFLPAGLAGELIPMTGGTRGERKSVQGLS